MEQSLEQVLHDMPKIEEEVFWVLKKKTFGEMTFFRLEKGEWIPAYEFYNPIVLSPDYYLRQGERYLPYRTYVLSDTLVRAVEIYFQEKRLDVLMETTEAYAKKRMFFAQRLRCFYEAKDGVTECYTRENQAFLRIEESREHRAYYRVSMRKGEIEKKLCYAFGVLHAYAVFSKDYTYSKESR